LIKELEEGLGGTVEDWDFDVVEVNEVLSRPRNRLG